MTYQDTMENTTKRAFFSLCLFLLKEGKSMRANGKDYTITSPTSLRDFLLKEGFNINRVVCERNGSIITQEKFADVMLANEDHLEIVQFVGGG